MNGLNDLKGKDVGLDIKEDPTIVWLRTVQFTILQLYNGMKVIMRSVEIILWNFPELVICNMVLSHSAGQWQHACSSQSAMQLRGWYSTMYCAVSYNAG
jgi:hypothetical protein